MVSSELYVAERESTLSRLRPVGTMAFPGRSDTVHCGSHIL